MRKLPVSALFAALAEPCKEGLSSVFHSALQPNAQLGQVLPITLVSDSKCVWTNLALEEVLQTHLHKALCGALGDDTAIATPVILTYIDDPAVVIGRNQNPWVECDVAQLIRSDSGVRRLRLARRQSGGGTVYHNSGNVCFSFFTHRTKYSPSRNLQLLKKAMMWAPILSCTENTITVTDRHDMLCNGKKISGSAMRLTGDTSMHHCTMLVDTKEHVGFVGPH